MSLVWINGTLVDKTDARVSLFDHGFLYGEGVWEHLRLFDGHLLCLMHHLELLFTAAEALGIEMPLSRDELAVAINATAKANERTQGYVRVIVTRGPGTIGPDPRKLDPQVIIVTEEYLPFPAELYGHGLHAVVCPIAFDSSFPANKVRCLGRPHIVLAKRHALKNGCLEALLTNQKGDVVGTTEGFLFLVKDGAVVVAAGQLVDATGYAVASLAGEEGLVVAEYAVKQADVLGAEEVFIAGTACGVIGIVRIDGQDIGAGTEGAITVALRERYNDLTRTKVE
jgi:branched-chain amino acid aminotransferase